MGWGKGVQTHGEAPYQGQGNKEAGARLARMEEALEERATNNGVHSRRHLNWKMAPLGEIRHVLSGLE